MRFLLDTDTISFALRGEGEVANRLRATRPSEICTSAIVVGELELGVRKRGSRRLRRALDHFYTGIAVLPYDQEAAKGYGRLVATLQAKGTPIGVEDSMLAAQAIAGGLTLVTHNLRHFQQVRGLKLADWY